MEDDEKRACYTGQLNPDNPWTPFNGNIIVTPALFIIFKKRKPSVKGINLLRKLRWPNGLRCLECNNSAVKTVGKGKIADNYFCPRCYARFSDTSRTIFDKTRTPIDAWIEAALILDRQPDISTRQLMLQTGIPYKSAWRIKKFLIQKTNDPLLKKLKNTFG